MTQTCYTAITFAPVQGFIEKSRKLRDLYGSSFILSYLAWSICQAAKNRNGCEVISPALPNVTQGMPNQIIIKGVLPEKIAEDTLNQAWGGIVQTCRQWIEDKVTGEWDYKIWRRDWGLWEKYTWEFFCVTGKSGQSISDVREMLNEKKRSRNWTAVNWTGESSTLSGADAIAYPSNPIKDIREHYYAKEKQAIIDFYKQLSLKLGEAFIKNANLHIPEAEKIAKAEEYGSAFVDPDEQLSIPELIKRLITHKAIVNDLFSLLLKEVGESNELQSIQAIADDLNPETFKDLDRLKRKKNATPQLVEERFTGWFQGDGDGAGNYFKTLKPKSPDKVKRQEEIEKEAIELKAFSEQMRDWGHTFKDNPPQFNNIPSCRIVYAGGDDFLGVFYRPNDLPALSPAQCVEYFSTFKSQVWHGSSPKNIQVSVGFVWAAPKVPQRDVLQHCREAEQSAKRNGRDRIAFRILFNGGNYLEWVCPWWLLEEGLLDAYCDRNGKQGLINKPNWGHFYEDVAVLEARHAFQNNTDVATGLIEIYFGQSYRDLITSNLWSERTVNRKTGILGSADPPKDEIEALNNWAIDLAKVGFHLCKQ
jgi:CRISPR-associated protein Cmr2